MKGSRGHLRNQADKALISAKSLIPEKTDSLLSDKRLPSKFAEALATRLPA
jgi:hypothetical protein